MTSQDLFAALQQVTRPTGGGAVGYATAGADAARAATARRASIAAMLGQAGVRGPMASPSSGISAGGGGGGYRPGANPHGVGLTTITAPNGQRVTVAANYAGKFAGLLRDLWNAGYHYKSVGGYNYRYIAGTHTLSKHATGEAIDIDPGANPVTYGGRMTTYFNPNVVIPILRRYGLDWGGLWTGSKKDPMHYSTGG